MWYEKSDSRDGNPEYALETGYITMNTWPVLYPFCIEPPIEELRLPIQQKLRRRRSGHCKSSQGSSRLVYLIS